MTRNNLANVKTAFLKKGLMSLLLLTLGGCALFPPQPPGCQGQFKPVNAAVEKKTNAEKSAADSHDERLNAAPETAEGAADGK